MGGYLIVLPEKNQIVLKKEACKNAALCLYVSPSGYIFKGRVSLHLLIDTAPPVPPIVIRVVTFLDLAGHVQTCRLLHLKIIRTLPPPHPSKPVSSYEYYQLKYCLRAFMFQFYAVILSTNCFPAP